MNTSRPRPFLGSAFLAFTFLVAVLLLTSANRAHAFSPEVAIYYTVGTTIGPSPTQVCGTRVISPGSLSGYVYAGTATAVTTSSSGQVCATLPKNTTLKGNFYVQYFIANDAYTFYGTAGPAGYVNPKYVILGVTYAPPGGTTASNVTYTSSTTSSSTASLQQSFSSAASYSVSVNIGATIPLVGGGIISASTTTTATQTNTSLDSATVTYITTTAEKTNGVPNTFLPVDHDYDIVWVWLNPALIFSVTSTGVITWNGYGVDTTDPEASGEMDVQAIYLGYLNGDFPMPADLSPTGSETPLSRWWASPSLYTYASGDSPALSAADLANIASADPFYNNQDALSSSSTTYKSQRYTPSNCGSFDYQQPSPGTYSCNDVYMSSATETDTAVNSFEVKYSVSDKVGADFLDVFKAGGSLSASQTLIWTTTTSSSSTNSLSTTAALSVNQGPTCTGSPCNPSYPAQPTEPEEFTVYQDNAYGTFMFQPTVYDGPWVGADGNTP